MWRLSVGEASNCKLQNAECKSQNEELFSPPFEKGGSGGISNRGLRQLVVFLHFSICTLHFALDVFSVKRDIFVKKLTYEDIWSTP
jgi:hypothetical protein